MKTFKNIIHESSLSRIMTHVEKTEQFGVISPYRKENSNKVNKENYAELIKTVRDMGYGYIELKGGYQEETGFVNEKSLFIPGISRKQIMELGKKYIQFSIIHKDKTDFSEIGTNKNAGIGKIISVFEIEGKNIKVDDIGDKFTDFFSKLVKGSHIKKRFIFKEKVEVSGYYRAKHGEMWVQI